MLRVLIVLGAAGGSAWLVARPTPGATAFQAMAIGAAGVVALVMMRWPPLGMVGLVVASLAVPFAVGTGTESRINAAMLIVAALTFWWLLEMVVRHDVRIIASAPVAASLALAVVSVLAFAVSTQPWHVFAQTAPLTAQVGGLSVVLLSACAFLLAAHRIPNLRWLQWLTAAFLILGAAHVVSRFSQDASTAARSLLGGVGLGSVFWVWVVVLAFGQAAFNRKLHPAWRVALGALVVVCFYQGLTYKDWTSGWLPPLVAVAVASLVAVPRLLPLYVVGGVWLAVVALPEVTAFMMGGDNQYSVSTRLEAWRIIAEIVSISPVLGLGFANYYWYTPLFPIMGYAVKFNSHNNYFDIVAQTGLLGLACFLWFAAAVGLLGWRLRNQVPSGFARAYVCSALGGLAGTLVAGMLGDWVLPFVYNIGLIGFRSSVLAWIFLGGLVALQQIAFRSLNAEVAEDVAPGQEAR
jgi:hypothetical protein